MIFDNLFFNNPWIAVDYISLSKTRHKQFIYGSKRKGTKGKIHIYKKKRQREELNMPE